MEIRTTETRIQSNSDHPLNTEQDTVKLRIKDALSRNQSFALWKLPDQSVKNLIISNQSHKIDEFELNECAPGFILSSFIPDGKKVFLPADEFYSLPHDLDKLNDLGFSHADKPSATSSHLKGLYVNKPLSFQPVEYASLVSDGIDQINQGKLEKIVISRQVDLPLSSAFDLIITFYKLCEKYPNALVSVVSSPQTGTWVGATPELLVQTTSDMKFRTVALAGTQLLPDGKSVKQIAWTEKEIEEQALVTRYIINCFKKIRVREYAEHGPRTAVAGNLVHLKSDFEVDMKAINFPTLGTVMLNLLHPTSAVCGMPRAEALQFLTEREGYDREFYSGYLGPVNIQQESNIYVNLRCMQLFNNTARLYAGAGITLDSDPSAEYKETELKLNIMKSLII